MRIRNRVLLSVSSRATFRDKTGDRDVCQGYSLGALYRAPYVDCGLPNAYVRKGVGHTSVYTPDPTRPAQTCNRFSQKLTGLDINTPCFLFHYATLRLQSARPADERVSLLRLREHKEKSGDGARPLTGS